MAQTILERGFVAQAKSLVEFGYPGVTAGEVRAAHRHWLSGGAGRDVIEMFCISAFEGHPEIFGTRPEGKL